MWMTLTCMLAVCRRCQQAEQLSVPHLPASSPISSRSWRKATASTTRMVRARPLSRSVRDKAFFDIKPWLHIFLCFLVFISSSKINCARSRSRLYPKSSARTSKLRKYSLSASWCLRPSKCLLHKLCCLVSHTSISIFALYFSNQRVPCAWLKKVDLTKWKE